jgi:hypothetical protein
MDSVELRFHPGDRSGIAVLDGGSTPNAYITKKENVVEVSLYYLHNMAIGCGWYFWPTSSCLGYHQHDIEYIRIYYEHGCPVSVFFSAHSAVQGSWFKWDECEHGDDGSLIVYVARNSHANYSSAGIHWRVFGLANDVCSEKGLHLRFSFASMIPSFDYTFPNGIALYKDLRPNTPAPEKVLSKWQKFILPLLKIFPC